MAEFPRVFSLCEREAAALYARLLVERRLLTICQGSVFSWLLFGTFDEATGVSTASRAVLARNCLVSEGSVFETIERLEKLGLVRRVPQGRGGTAIKGPNAYELFGPCRRVDAELAARSLPEAPARGGRKVVKRLA